MTDAIMLVRPFAVDEWARHKEQVARTKHLVSIKYLRVSTTEFELLHASTGNGNPTLRIDPFHKTSTVEILRRLVLPRRQFPSRYSNETFRESGNINIDFS